MAFQKGQSGNPAGRKRGQFGKAGKNAREAFQAAFDALGGFEELTRWAAKNDENRRVFYNLYGRLIPIEHGGTNGGPIIMKLIEESV